MSVAAGVIEVRRIEGDLERHRPALTRHCARMLGSWSEAEDAVQETLLRAWRGHGRFERRAALQTWLHRIATNVCIDMLNDRSRRAVPVDPAPLESVPTEADAETDPATRALAREAFRLALLAAIERLPARQRAVLLLREVFCWRASETAQLLGVSTAAVNSALQRARSALDRTSSEAGPTPAPAVEDSNRALVASYLAGFEEYEFPARTLAEVHQSSCQKSHNRWELC